MDYLSSPKLKKTQTQTSYLYRQKKFFKIPKICNHFLGGCCFKPLNNNIYQNDFYCSKCQFITCCSCYSNRCQLCNQKYIEALNLFLGKNYYTYRNLK